MSSTQNTFNMCDSNIKNGKLDFTGNTTECYCKDGKEYQHVKTCVACKGKGKIPKNGRNYRCKACDGSRWVRLEVSILVGDCVRCKGTARIAANRCDRVTEVDRETLFGLFNFDKPYSARTSSFNEGYLGIGIVAGVTDYGRYLTMTPEEFKVEVKDNFIKGHMQYAHFTDRDGNLPKEILIAKKQSSWFAYVVH